MTLRCPHLHNVAIAARPLIVLLAAVCSVSCARFNGLQTQPSSTARLTSARIVLEGKPFDLHLAVPARPMAPDVLVLFASGDGGWFGAAVDMFKEIAGDGYYAVGFSSRTFLNLGRLSDGPGKLDRLVDDYRRVIAQARVALRLPASTRTVLTGWSRGAAFAVLVASEPRAQPDLLGVVAIGLADGEDLNTSSNAGDRDDDGHPRPVPHRAPFETYRRIPRISPLPCAVIQATHDNYLPASEARPLFGDDSPTRRFFSVDARNHRFSGGKAQFDRALDLALAWIVSR
jgi:dienelactone hydrolase